MDGEPAAALLAGALTNHAQVVETAKNGAIALDKLARDLVQRVLPGQCPPRRAVRLSWLAGVERDALVSDNPRPDPQAEAERKLRMALAAEARAERVRWGRIQKGAYGCLTIFVLLFLLALFFT